MGEWVESSCEFEWALHSCGALPLQYNHTVPTSMEWGYIVGGKRTSGDNVERARAKFCVLRGRGGRERDATQHPREHYSFLNQFQRYMVFVRSM